MKYAALLIVLLALAGCSPVGLLNAFVPEKGLERHAAIAYGDDPRQRLDVYLPRQGALSLCGPNTKLRK